MWLTRFADFMVLLGSVLAFIGLVLVARSFVIDGEAIARIHIAPLAIIAVAVVLFGLLLQPLALYVADSIFIGDYLTTRGELPERDLQMLEDAGFVAALPPGMTLLQFGDELDRDGAFLDTAAIMGLCERVISSDTSVAHLAGALQVPTWLALKPVPDWRWLLDRADSPWYPSMRLFRRGIGEDWQPVMQAMARELALAKA